jgi:hypothetical protein
MATMWDEFMRTVPGASRSRVLPPGVAGGSMPMMPMMPQSPVPSMASAPPMVAASDFFPSIPPSGIQPLAPVREIGAAPGMSAPPPPVRSSAPGAPMQLASAAPSVRESFMQRLLGGPVYQSNGMPLLAQPQGPTPSGATLPPAMQATTPQQINFGNPDNPADFVRADRALMGLPEDALRIAGLLG